MNNSIKTQFKSGKAHPRWKGGKGKCLDCGVVLNKYSAKRCLTCHVLYMHEHREDYGGYVDGRSELIELVRKSKKYRVWRSHVFERDGWTCQTCHAKGYVEAHHKIRFSILWEKYHIKTYKQAMRCKDLWDINNGVALCQECHEMTKGRLACQLS